MDHKSHSRLDGPDQQQVVRLDAPFIQDVELAVLEIDKAATENHVLLALSVRIFTRADETNFDPPTP